MVKTCQNELGGYREFIRGFGRSSFLHGQCATIVHGACCRQTPWTRSCTVHIGAYTGQMKVALLHGETHHSPIPLEPNAI